MRENAFRHERGGIGLERRNDQTLGPYRDAVSRARIEAICPNVLGELALPGGRKP